MEKELITRFLFYLGEFQTIKLGNYASGIDTEIFEGPEKTK